MKRAAAFALLSLLLVNPARSHIDDTSRAPTPGKTEEYARGDIEFRLPSTNLRSYALHDFDDYKYVLLVAVSSADKCLSVTQEDDFDKLQKSLSKSKLARVVLIDSNPRAVREDLEKKKRSSVFLFDSYQQVSKSFGFGKVGDFALIEPTKPQTVASGNLSAPPSELKKQWSKLKSLKSEPCEVSYQGVSSPDFQTAFVKPFGRACVNCHITTEVYDHFKTLDETLGWRAMSLKTIRLRRMPGNFDPYDRVPNSNLTDEDIRNVVAWLESPPEITDEMRAKYLESYSELKKKFENRKYDGPVLATLKTPEAVEVAANEPTTYRNFFLGKPTTEDMVIQGVRLKTNLNVVHHANLFALKDDSITKAGFVDEGMFLNTLLERFRHIYGRLSFQELPGELNGKSAKFYKINESIVTTFSRRAGTIPFPEDTAFFVPKGTQFAVQLHLQGSGKKETVDTQFEILGRTYKTPYKKLRRITVNPLDSFLLKPHQKSYISKSTIPFSKPAQLKNLWVHTHFRGVAARVSLKEPDGRIRRVASFPFLQMKVDQSRSFWNNGIPIAAGSELITEIEYDNSSANFANPDPTLPIKLGGSTFGDEMHFPRFVFTED